MSESGAIIERVRRFRAGILERHLDTPLFRQSLRDVKRVVIINASSRSGSSLLYALLSKLPRVYSLTGEAVPFYKLNTTGEGFDPLASDAIPAELADTAMDRAGLARDFFSDMYRAGDGIATKEIDLSTYGDRLMLRFALQWTEADFDSGILRACIDEAFGEYVADHPRFRAADFYLTLLEKVMVPYPEITPYYYDIDPGAVALRFPRLPVPVGPPNATLNIEEPPFILQTPRVPATPADLSAGILLLKSTVDCYRMNLIEWLFPAADIRVIHLVRNPAAATNGIYDGWLHRGFFSHNLAPYFERGAGVKGLRIKGYSDQFSFGSRWWNFDLPEGWQAVADKELAEVCAFQWRAANAAIVHYLASSGRRHCRVRFEEIVKSTESRREELLRILDFMGLPGDQISALGLDELPVVQSTQAPQPYRWKKREGMITRVVGSPEMVRMAEELGYRAGRRDEWL